MAWVVDTSVILDILTADPQFEPASTACLQAHLVEGIIICPVTFIELGPSFRGDGAAAEAFLAAARIGILDYWKPEDTLLAHRLWYDYQLRRRQFQTPKRPVADVLIAAFASRFQGLITRNAVDFRAVAPHLRIAVP